MHATLKRHVFTRRTARWAHNSTQGQTLAQVAATITSNDPPSWQESDAAPELFANARIKDSDSPSAVYSAPDGADTFRLARRNADGTWRLCHGIAAYSLKLPGFAAPGRLPYDVLRVAVPVRADRWMPDPVFVHAFVTESATPPGPSGNWGSAAEAATTNVPGDGEAANLNADEPDPDYPPPFWASPADEHGGIPRITAAQAAAVRESGRDNVAVLELSGAHVDGRDMWLHIVIDCDSGIIHDTGHRDEMGQDTGEESWYEGSAAVRPEGLAVEFSADVDLDLEPDEWYRCGLGVHNAVEKYSLVSASAPKDAIAGRPAALCGTVVKYGDGGEDRFDASYNATASIYKGADAEWAAVFTFPFSGPGRRFGRILLPDAQAPNWRYDGGIPHRVVALAVRRAAFQGEAIGIGALAPDPESVMALASATAGFRRLVDFACRPVDGPYPFAFNHGQFGRYANSLNAYVLGSAESQDGAVIRAIANSADGSGMAFDAMWYLMLAYFATDGFPLANAGAEVYPGVPVLELE